jgi:hypothetical protein
MPSIPPALDLVHQVHAVLRFISTSATSTQVDIPELLAACGGICTVTNTTLAVWASSVKLHSIKIWAASGGAAVIEWGNLNSVGKEAIKDQTTPTGVTLAGCSFWRPPRGTYWEDWLEGTASAPIFSIQTTVGSIVDVDVSYTMEAGTFALTTYPIATGVLGNPYYLSLDGGTSNKYPPVGLPTTH